MESKYFHRTLAELVDVGVVVVMMVDLEAVTVRDKNPAGWESTLCHRIYSQSWLRWGWL